MTTRSFHNVEQFEERLQQWCHEAPKFLRATVQLAGKERVEIVFVYSENGKPIRIRLYGTRKTGIIKKMYGMEWEEEESWGLVLEKKNYMNTPHSTKISGEDPKALEWLNKIMEGIEPKPRFKLSEYLRPNRP